MEKPAIAVNDCELKALIVLKTLQSTGHPPGSWFSIKRVSANRYLLQDHTGDKKYLNLSVTIERKYYMATVDGDGNTLLNLLRKLAVGNTLRINKNRRAQIDFSIPKP